MLSHNLTGASDKLRSDPFFQAKFETKQSCLAKFQGKLEKETEFSLSLRTKKASQ